MIDLSYSQLSARGMQEGMDQQQKDRDRSDEISNPNLKRNCCARITIVADVRSHLTNVRMSGAIEEGKLHRVWERSGVGGESASLKLHNRSRLVFRLTLRGQQQSEAGANDSRCAKQ